MKIRSTILTLLLIFCIRVCTAKEEPIPYGIINFTTCITESKYGKEEQKTIEQMENQFSTLMNDLDKQVREIEEKLNNPEFIDSLSPEAEQEFKAKRQTLYEEGMRYQNQYGQFRQQAQIRLFHNMNAQISEAAAVIAKRKNIPLMLNKEMVFYSLPNYDMTNLVIEEMDKKFHKENPQKELPPQPPTK